jgi:hypothetical protein
MINSLSSYSAFEREVRVKKLAKGKNINEDRREAFTKASIFINKMQVYVHIMVISFSLLNFFNTKKVIEI